MVAIHSSNLIHHSFYGPNQMQDKFSSINLFI